MSNHVNIKPTHCSYCKRQMRKAAPLIASVDAPQTGSISICWFCTGINIVEADMSLRAVTDAELKDLYKNSDLVRAVIGVIISREPRERMENYRWN